MKFSQLIVTFSVLELAKRVIGYLPEQFEAKYKR